jgi:hypothetical protein
VGTLVSCGPAATSGVQTPAASTAAGQPSPSAQPVLPSPPASPASTVPRSPGAANPSPGSIDTTDPSSDATTGFTDIVRLQAEPIQGSISLMLSLAAPVPPGTPAVGQLAYRFYLDTDGDGTWDDMAALEAVPGGGFVPVLVDRLTGRRREGAEYPGTAALSGQLVSMTVRLADIGCPPVIRVRAVAEQTIGGAATRDEVPDGVNDWLPVDTGCPAS